MKRSPLEVALVGELSSEEEKKYHHKVEFFAVEKGESVHLPLDNPEILKGLPGSSSFIDASFCSQNLDLYYNPVDSVILANNPKGIQTVGGRSGSSREQSDDDDDLEIEASPCEQGANSVDEKRVRRMTSNRESAQRSRKRKQAHATELEQQVEQLRGENSSLFTQLSDATQQFKDATTNNRVLKSNVEALRAKVKLAEDLVARGSLTSSLSHLLENYLNTTPEDYMNGNVNIVDNFPPAMGAFGDESPTYSALTDSTFGVGFENVEALIGSSINGVTGDTVQEIRPWKSHVAPESK